MIVTLYLLATQMGELPDDVLMYLLSMVDCSTAVSLLFVSKYHKRLTLAVFKKLTPQRGSEDAGRHGYVTLLMWMGKNRFIWHPYGVTYEATEGGHIEVLKSMHTLGMSPLSTNHMKIAAANGHLHIMEWLASKGTSIGYHTLCLAARNNRMNVIDHYIVLLKKHSVNEFTHDIAVCGNIEVIKSLYDRDCLSVYHLYNEIIKKGLLDVLKWLVDNIPAPLKIVNTAIFHDSQAVVEWCVEKKLHDGYRLLRITAKELDQYAIAQWLKANKRSIKQ